MTNEEIEKRFQFDLEMNYFNKNGTGFDFIIFSTRYNSNIEKLEMILGSLGFKVGYKSIAEKPYYKFIFIHTSKKIYEILTPMKFYENFIINPLPDYIKKYKIS